MKVTGLSLAFGLQIQPDACTKRARRGGRGVIGDDVADTKSMEPLALMGHEPGNKRPSLSAKHPFWAAA